MRPLVLALLLALPSLASAAKLRVDVLIFLHPASAEERGSAPRHPDDERAIAIDDVRGLAYAGVALMPPEATTLAAEWKQLGASGRYTPLLRLSWLQDTPRAEGGPMLKVFMPAGDRQTGLSGWLRLHQGKSGAALSADLESIDLVPAAAAGTAPSALALRLQQQRVVGMDRLHYLDSPRIGVLARVTAAR